MFSCSHVSRESHVSRICARSRTQGRDNSSVWLGFRQAVVDHAEQGGGLEGLSRTTSRAKPCSQPQRLDSQHVAWATRAWSGRPADRCRLSICGAWRSPSALFPATPDFPQHRPRRHRPCIFQQANQCVAVISAANTKAVCPLSCIGTARRSLGDRVDLQTVINWLS